MRQGRSGARYEHEALRLRAPPADDAVGAARLHATPYQGGVDGAHHPPHRGEEQQGEGENRRRPREKRAKRLEESRQNVSSTIEFFLLPLIIFRCCAEIFQRAEETPIDVSRESRVILEPKRFRSTLAERADLNFSRESRMILYTTIKKRISDAVDSRNRRNN